MVDPLARRESAHALEELIDRVHECGSITPAEIVKVAHDLSITPQEVWRELEKRGVPLPAGALNGEHDPEELEEADAADDDDELEPTHLNTAEIEDEMRPAPLMISTGEPLGDHPHVEEAVDVPDAPAAIYLRDIS